MKEKLIAKFEQKDVLLHDAYQKPVTVWIDEETSMELNYQGWPTICRGDGDTLYVSSSIRRGHVDPYGATAFYVSHDRGKTWSEPRVINDTPADDRDTGVAYLGDGRIVVSFFTIGLNYFLPGGQWDVLMNYGDERQAAAKIKQGQALPEDDQYRNSGSYLIFSEDYGKTWSAPHKVPACDPHGPSIANDGSLLQCRANINTGCECYQSFDGGKTWESRFVIDLQNLPEGRTLYSEPYILQLKNGHYLLGIRGQNHSVKNSDHTLCVFLAHSDDGRTFTQPAPIPGVIGAPPHFLELSNGNILLTYSYRGGAEGAMGVRGRVSYDNGYTWDDEIILSEAPEGTLGGEVGYPSTVELDDGTLMTVYYQPAGSENRPAILYTKWRLEEAEG